MKADSVQLNLVFAWAWILLGFVSGMVLGMFFHKENWLGGYGSLRRRMYRLGHISFFGLGAVNLMFWLTMQKLSFSGPAVLAASWAFIIGGLAMPLCCLLMAHNPRSRMLFSVPVLALIAGGVLTLFVLQQSTTPAAAAVHPVNQQLLTSNPP